MKVLGITTSTARGGAAVWVDGHVVGERDYEDLHGHAERVFAAIEGALADAGVSKHELDVIACDVGPGSFTGVRVGVATCKGIASGLGVPVAGVGSLAALAERAFAEGVANAGELALTAMDAKRGELYVSLLGAAGEEWMTPRLVALDDIESLLVEARAFSTTRGAGLSIALVGEWPVAFAQSRFGKVDAASVARLGANAFSNGHLAELEPIYVRPPDAKLPSA